MRTVRSSLELSTKISPFFASWRLKVRPCESCDTKSGVRDAASEGAARSTREQASSALCNLAFVETDEEAGEEPEAGGGHPLQGEWHA